MMVLAVLASAVDDIRDIRGPIVTPPSHPWWPYLVAAAVVVAIALGVRAWVRSRRKPLPPGARALRALEAARTSIEGADAHGFSLQVSDAVRAYVEAAFTVHAPRLTTPELLAELMTDESPVAAHRGELGTFLEFCDLAKYARWSLSRVDMTAMLASAEAFVRATASPAGGGS